MLKKVIYIATTAILVAYVIATPAYKVTNPYGTFQSPTVSSNLADLNGGVKPIKK